MARSGASLEEKQRRMRERHASERPVACSDDSEASSAASSSGERPRIDVNKPPPSMASAQPKPRRGDVLLDLTNFPMPDNMLLSLVDDWIVSALVEQFLHGELGVGARSDPGHN